MNVSAIRQRPGLLEKQPLLMLALYEVRRILEEEDKNHIKNNLRDRELSKTEEEKKQREFSESRRNREQPSIVQAYFRLSMVENMTISGIGPVQVTSNPVYLLATYTKQKSSTADKGTIVVYGNFPGFATQSDSNESHEPLKAA